jgi:CHAD domain-containing protein
MPLHFKLPGHLSIDKLLLELQKQTVLELVSQHFALKTFYDSFDWRLYRKNLICEYDQSRLSSTLFFKEADSDKIVHSVQIDQVPSFANDFIQAELRELLSPLLDMRALMQITTLDYTHYQLHIHNSDAKTVLKMTLEHYDPIQSRVILDPVKGYDKALKRMSKLLSSLGLILTQEPVLVDALKTQGRKPKDYSSKLNIKLAPDMRADIAVKYIYSHLLKTLKLNEQGVIADFDSEFLHDFRVAVRRTRTGLTQLKQVLPVAQTKRFSRYFSWLGQITSEPRDMDIYLLHFDTFKNYLPEAMKADLDPLYDFLVQKKRAVHAGLIDKLKSIDYYAPLIEWEDFIRSAAIKKPDETQALIPVKALADQRIWVIYKKVIKQACAIKEDARPSELHELRKTCKKLRYLMEFFQSLYPESTLKLLIRSLKEFQEILGTYQDLEIQQQTLRELGKEMYSQTESPQTLLAMGALIEALEKQKVETRSAFDERFNDFNQADNRTIFETLFKCGAA